jgi:hypothetical protein
MSTTNLSSACVPASGPEAKRNIPMYSEGIAKSLSELEETIGKLENRLSSALVPAIPAPSCNENQEKVLPISQMAEELSKHILYIDILNSRLRCLCDRLEI